jgi:tetratricopeptide (TPR) repeat protein
MKRAIIIVLILLAGFSVLTAQETLRQTNPNAVAAADKTGVLSKFNLKGVTEANVSDIAIDLNNQGIKKAFGEKNYPASVGYFRQAVEIAPNCLTCRYNLAMSLLQIGEAAEALEILQKIVTLETKSAEYLTAYGEALHHTGRIQEAIVFLEKAISIKPNDAAILNKLGNSLYQIKEYDRSLKCFDAAIKAQPDLSAAHSNRGAALYALERYKESVESLRRALALEPDSAEANNNLGVVLSHVGKKKEAAKYFSEAVRLRPNWSYPLYNLAANQLERGDRDAARAVLASLEKVDTELAGKLRKHLWQKFVINASR